MSGFSGERLITGGMIAMDAVTDFNIAGTSEVTSFYEIFPHLNIQSERVRQVEIEGKPLEDPKVLQWISDAVVSFDEKLEEMWPRLTKKDGTSVFTQLKTPEAMGTLRQKYTEQVKRLMEQYDDSISITPLWGAVGQAEKLLKAGISKKRIYPEKISTTKGTELGAASDIHLTPELEEWIKIHRNSLIFFCDDVGDSGSTLIQTALKILKLRLKEDEEMDPRYTSLPDRLKKIKEDHEESFPDFKDKDIYGDIWEVSSELYEKAGTVVANLFSKNEGSYDGVERRAKGGVSKWALAQTGTLQVTEKADQFAWLTAGGDEHGMFDLGPSCESIPFYWNGILRDSSNVKVRLAARVRPLLQMNNGKDHEGEVMIADLFAQHLKQQKELLRV